MGAESSCTPFAAEAGVAGSDVPQGRRIISTGAGDEPILAFGPLRRYTGAEPPDSVRLGQPESRTGTTLKLMSLAQGLTGAKFHSNQFGSGKLERELGMLPQ